MALPQNIDPAYMARLQAMYQNYRPGETSTPYIKGPGDQYGFQARFGTPIYNGEGNQLTMAPIEGYTVGNYDPRTGGNMQVYDTSGKDTGKSEFWEPDRQAWMDNVAMMAPVAFAVPFAMGVGAAGAAGAGAGFAGDATAAGYAGLDAASTATMGGGASVTGGSALGAGGAAGAAGAAGVGLAGDATAAGYGGLDAASASTMGGGASVNGGAALGAGSALVPGTEVFTNTLNLPAEQTLMQTTGSSVVKNALAEALGISPKVLGLGASLLGGALSAGQKNSSSADRSIPEWLKGYATPALDAGKGLLQQQMSWVPQQAQQIANSGFGLLSQPIAGNGVSQFQQRPALFRSFGG